MWEEFVRIFSFWFSVFVRYSKIVLSFLTKCCFSIVQNKKKYWIAHILVIRVLSLGKILIPIVFFQNFWEIISRILREKIEMKSELPNGLYFPHYVRNFIGWRFPLKNQHQSSSKKESQNFPFLCFIYFKQFYKSFVIFSFLFHFSFTWDQLIPHSKQFQSNSTE